MLAYYGGWRKTTSQLNIKWSIAVNILLWITAIITDEFHGYPPKSTIDVFIDMLAAFDKVWRQSLLLQLYETWCKGRGFLWIIKSLSDQYIIVRCNG